jgi:hypothetical protein
VLNDPRLAEQIPKGSSVGIREIKKIFQV